MAHNELMSVAMLFMLYSLDKRVKRTLGPRNTCPVLDLPYIVGFSEWMQATGVSISAYAPPTSPAKASIILDFDFMRWMGFWLGLNFFSLVTDFFQVNNTPFSQTSSTNTRTYARSKLYNWKIQFNSMNLFAKVLPNFAFCRANKPLVLTLLFR